MVVFVATALLIAMVVASNGSPIDGFMKLVVSIAGMLGHGHGDDKYAHYALDSHSPDSNATIGFIAKLLRDLQ